MAIIGADETFKKISSLVESQFPEFMREDGPRFVAFLKAYYEYMEQETSNSGPGPIHASRSLTEYNDIDRTLDQFLDQFQKEFMVQIPTSIQTDKRLLSKYIQDFYKTRGSRTSYQLLFRALFDEEVYFYEPGNDILRASDGRWVISTTLIVGPPFTSDPTLMDGKLITDLETGATGRVEEVVRVVIRGATAYRFRLENVTGTFRDGDTIEAETGGRAQIAADLGTIVRVDVVDGGGYHNIGDTVTITGQSSGASAVAQVLSVGTANAATITIVDGGSGYETGVNTSIIVSGGSGAALRATVTALSNTTTANLATQTILPAASVKLNGDGANVAFAVSGSNTATLTFKFATANVNSQLTDAFDYTDVTIGAIDKIRIDDVGSGYSSLPAVSAINYRVRDLDLDSLSYTGAKRGEDAIFVSNTAAGSVTELLIQSGDPTFLKEETITFTSRKTQSEIAETYRDRDNILRTTVRFAHYDGSGEATVSGVTTDSGKYFGTRGFISWDKKLQDNFYYQEYSYVLRANKRVSDYRDIVKKVLHPAGTKMFGEQLITITANVPPTAVVVVPTDYNVSVSEAAVANASLVGYASRIANSAESFSATETEVAYVDRPGTVSESVTATESEAVVVDFVDSVSESVTTTETEVVQVDAGATVSESVTSTETEVVQVDAGGAVSESVTATDSEVVVVAKIGNISESVTATDQPIVSHYKLDEYYISVQYANNQILPYQSTQITVYDDVTIETFDGTPRLVTAVSPDEGTTASFAGGTLKANTGIIQVGGYGSNLIIVPIGDTWDGSTLYTVNTIFSNTAMTIRQFFEPVTANATFSYSTSS